MQKQVIGLLVLITISLAACPAAYNINNLVADSVTFSVNANTSSSSQSYVYTFQQSFTNSPALALGVQDFSINYLGPNSFAVYPSTLSNSQISFGFDYTAALWTRVKINFFASGNSQLQLGYFKVDNIQTSGSCNCALAYANINSAFAPSENPVIRVFINGFDFSSNSAQISVSPTNLQVTKLTIKITVGAKTSLKRIWLSWLAFSPTSASFGSYGGQVSQSKYSGSVSSDISNSLYQSPYVFYGLSVLSLSSSQPLTFSSDVDSGFVLTVSASSLIEDFSLVYIALGVLPSKHCSSCGNGLLACNSNCVSTCPAGTYPFTYKDGGVACRTCSQKLGFILANGKCTVGSTTVSTTTTTTIISAGSSNSSANTQQSSSAAAASSAAAIVTIPVTRTPTPAVAPAVTANVQKTFLFAPNSCPVNSFFNGNECVCDVGYVYQNGKCQAPLISNSFPVLIGSAGQQSSATASSSYATTASSATSSSSSTSQSQVSTNSASQATSVQSTSVSSQSTSADCGANSYNNGLGICVCNQGCYFSNGSCISGVQCGSNAHRAADGSCACDSGYSNYSGICSMCPQGALWSSSVNQCIFVCGQNSAYSTTAKACVCNPGYGLLGGSCQSCPVNYFISNGYCVTCPVNSAYNVATKSCDCLAGYFTNQWGICGKKCGTNEIYNSTTQACSCIAGLGKINGACQICPTGSTPTNDGGSACSACSVNQVLVKGSCVCQQGYAYNSANVCTPCSSLSNGFLVNGICAVCPGSLIYNGNTCVCPQGKTPQGSLCISQCQSDELLDSNGNCYTCGNNQVISNGACVCAAGYSVNSCGVCALSCASGQFVFQGACATCPLNTIFNTAINGCSCPSGYYMNTYGICEKLTLQPIACQSGQYFDSNTGCTACSSSCKTCKSATQCITCASAGYSANSQGVCSPTCGDGLIVGSESCDTGSSYAAGCINCQIQTGYSCSGQPSTCKSNAPAPTVTPAAPSVPSTPSAPSTPAAPTTTPALAQFGTTSINSNNVFISLKTNPTFTFANPTEMQSFIQATFPSGPKPTVYCAQRNSPNLNIFDCLLIYPSGVPNSQFQVNFAFNFQGKSGSAIVKVNPLTASNSVTSSASSISAAPAKPLSRNNP